MVEPAREEGAGPIKAEAATSVADDQRRLPLAQDPRITPAPGFLEDPEVLSTFIEKLRAAGVRALEHPSGFRVSFEATVRKGGPEW